MEPQGRDGVWWSDLGEEPEMASERHLEHWRNYLLASDLILSSLLANQLSLFWPQGKNSNQFSHSGQVWGPRGCVVPWPLSGAGAENQSWLRQL